MMIFDRLIHILQEWKRNGQNRACIDRFDLQLYKIRTRTRKQILLYIYIHNAFETKLPININKEGGLSL